MRVRIKLWLDEDEQVLFGEGIRNLLLAIDQTGSINQASEKLNMSYRRAWERIHRAEERLGEALVISQTGGSHGGGSTLTDKGKELLRKYDQLEEEVAQFAIERFNELFIPNKQE